MTRNVFILFALAALHADLCFATADSALLQGLGGAGRAGIPKESLFSNPAAAAFLTDSSGFVNYVKPKIPDFNAGGRGYSVGIYDGEQGDWKGAFGYTRSSRAVLQNSRQAYEDRSDLRFILARQLGGSLVGGGQVRYVKTRAGANEEKFIQGDLGTIFQLSGDMRVGITYENILKQRPGEIPPTLGGGVQYALGFGIETFADGTRQMSGPRKGDKGWAAGAQAPLAAGFVARAGKFQEGVRRLKGWSLGLGWIGPRTTFDYSLRTAGTKNRERDHLFGMNVSF